MVEMSTVRSDIHWQKMPQLSWSSAWPTSIALFSFSEVSDSAAVARTALLL